MIIIKVREIPLFCLIVVSIGALGCAENEVLARKAAYKGNHAEAARHYFAAAVEQEKMYHRLLPPDIGKPYCAAAMGFLKAGGAENTRMAEEAAQKGIELSGLALHKAAQDTSPSGLFSQKYANRYVFRCRLALAESAAQTNRIHHARSLAQDYVNLSPYLAAALVDWSQDIYYDNASSPWELTGDENSKNTFELLTHFLRSQDPRLADAVEAKYAASTLLVAEQKRMDEVAAQETQVRQAQEFQAQAEYERQHPEIARAKQAQAAAEKQCAACKSSCDSQSLGCIAACFGNVEDTMCSGRCQVALNTCKNGCEEQRDALIVQAGGTPLGTSSSGTAALLQGLVTMGDSMAAAKGLPSSGTSGFATSATPSMQTSMASFAQALSALAGSTVVAPRSKRSSSQTAKAEGAPSISVGNICDDSAEVREVQAMEKRLPIEVKGMRGKRLGCYIAGQSVKIAQLQMRAATRCNTDLVEAREYLLEVQADERKACQGVSMK